jgi:hypothetical protein
MKIKITINAEYDIPDDFRYEESNEPATISHKDNLTVKYEPDAFINFDHVESDTNDIKQKMPEHLQKKIDDAFRQATVEMEVIK